MEELQLRKTMGGGYKREDVTEYVDSLVKKYEDLLDAAKKDAEEAKAEAEAAAKENAKLFEKLHTLESERDSVSRAVISAQREADKILQDAKAEADALLREKQLEISRMDSELFSVRSEIHSLRLSAAAALRRYESSLADIVPDAEEEEEE